MWGEKMNVVITGSTRGIGFGMAREFLKRGHDVLISSRHQDAVDQALANLQDAAPERVVAGQVCDVASFDQVQALWERSVEALGSVDIWVNNAGRDGIKLPFFALPPDDYVKTVNTNMIGLLNCNRVVIPGMYKQGGGKIFNMEGFGSNGMVRPTASVYGATKYALRYFTRALVQELENTPVKMCYLSPGMVITDMLVPPPEKRDQRWDETKKFLNIMADTVETVTPFLVEGMLKANRNGDAVRWLTRAKIMRRRLMAKVRTRDLFTPLGL
jgi:short-subunit dehydrogenase